MDVVTQVDPVVKQGIAQDPNPAVPGTRISGINLKNRDRTSMKGGYKQIFKVTKKETVELKRTLRLIQQRPGYFPWETLKKIIEKQ